MPSIDPELFSIQRPPLDRYRFLAQSGLIVETYRSAAGQMQSQGSLHRISINRTAHRHYAYRSGKGAFRAIARPPFTLALQPASVVLEVDGDSADYISIFQAPDLYRSIAGADFQPEDWDHEVLSTALDPVALHIALSLALAVEASDGDAGNADPLLLEHLSQGLACRVVKLLGSRLPSGSAPRAHARSNHQGCGGDRLYRRPSRRTHAERREARRGRPFEPLSLQPGLQDRDRPGAASLRAGASGRARPLHLAAAGKPRRHRLLDRLFEPGAFQQHLPPPDRGHPEAVPAIGPSLVHAGLDPSNAARLRKTTAEI
jgi:hypothetical protein